MKKILSGLMLSITSIAFASAAFANQPVEKHPQGQVMPAHTQQQAPKDAKGQQKHQASKDAKDQQRPQPPKDAKDQHKQPPKDANGQHKPEASKK